jgi:CelD/BcsL family acetyltransferase involved in cellulose biosynthesis
MWRREVATTIGPAELRELVASIRGQGRGIDILLLRNQPQSWGGVGNPFALITQQPSPSFGYRGSLMPDFEALTKLRISSDQRSKIRRKERTYADRGQIRYWRVNDPADADRVLETFFAQKGERMRDLGLADVFAAPKVREFIRDAATTHLIEGRPAIELYAMAVGDVIVATAGGVVGDGRFCTMFNSMIRGELAQKSPGQLLLYNVVRMACERGLNTFDLGVGEAAYKEMFCNETEPLFDSFLPLTAVGQLHAAAIRTANRTKRRIKQSTVLWRAVQLLRHYRAWLGDAR